MKIKRNCSVSCHFEVIRQPTTVGEAIYATDGRDVLSSHAEADGASMMPCTHEEADTRLLLHVADAVNRGSHRAECLDIINYS